MHYYSHFNLMVKLMVGQYPIGDRGALILGGLDFQQAGSTIKLHFFNTEIF